VVICSDRSEIVPVYDSTRATGVAAFVDKGVAGRAVLCSAAAVGLAGAELWCPVANKKKPVPTPILTIRASAMSNNAARLLAAGARGGTFTAGGAGVSASPPGKSGDGGAASSAPTGTGGFCSSASAGSTCGGACFSCLLHSSARKEKRLLHPCLRRERFFRGIGKQQEHKREEIQQAEKP
jgi:hypothetical protein